MKTSPLSKRIGARLSRVSSRVLLCAMKVVALTPWRFQCVLGSVAGCFLYRFMRCRRGIASANLKYCFPQFDDAARSRILRRHFRSLGFGLFEITTAWWGSDEHVARRSKVLGGEHLEKALSHGKGVILFSGHFTTFEIGARILASQFALDAIYRPHNDPWWDKVLRAGRQRYLSDLIERKNVKAMVRCLSKNRILWYAPDQDRGGRRYVFASFFAGRAATTTATSWLARVSGARVVPYMAHRRVDDSGWDVVIEPALENFPSGDELADTERLNGVLEGLIEPAVEQYLWIHRRFKTQPPGSPPVYGETLLRRR